jgi:hypothetical protein
LKKRSKKLLDLYARVAISPRAIMPKFFGSFFQKRTASFLRKRITHKKPIPKHKPMPKVASGLRHDGA